VLLVVAKDLSFASRRFRFSRLGCLRHGLLNFREIQYPIVRECDDLITQGTVERVQPQQAPCGKIVKCFTVRGSAKRLAPLEDRFPVQLIAEATFAVLSRRLACRTGDTCTTPASSLQHF